MVKKKDVNNSSQKIQAKHLKNLNLCLPNLYKIINIHIFLCFRREFSLFVGDLSDEVDDFILFRAFVKKYPSCQTAKGLFAFFKFLFLEMYRK